MPINVELHCHNSFSNFHLGAKEPQHDCNISVRDQLEHSCKQGLDAVFVTNHNTLDGYRQMLEYKNDHEKFKDIGVFAAEEITTNSGEHVLAYGIHDAIAPGITLEEALDAIRDQGAVSSAPHPFSLINGLRENAKRCEMIEVFNSNNVDVFSNARAVQFAHDYRMVRVAGSDSHVLSTLGRCINVIDSENDIDDILHAMRKGRIEITQTGYALQAETLDHLKYKINNSKEYIMEYVAEHYPHERWLFALLLRIYNSNQNSYAWSLFYKIAVYAIRRLSQKINLQNKDPSFMAERNLGTIFKMAL